MSFGAIDSHSALVDGICRWWRLLVIMIFFAPHTTMHVMGTADFVVAQAIITSLEMAETTRVFIAGNLG